VVKIAQLNEVVAEVKRNLEKDASPKRAVFERGYHKSSLTFLGANVPSQQREGKRLVREGKAMDRAALLALEAELWNSDIHELRGVACHLLCAKSNLLEETDIEFLRQRIVSAGGWAHVDTLSVHCVGPLIERLNLHDHLDAWAKDECFWVRRASMLALLKPLSGGNLSQWGRFTTYASTMMEEKEFFIRKAIGWILREVSKKNPDHVFAFLSEETDRVSGLTRRVGAKYLSLDMRSKLGLS